MPDSEVNESAQTETQPTDRDSFVTICGRVFHADPRYFPTAQYRGRTIYMCTDSCLGAFLSDPDRFVAAHKKKPSPSTDVCPPNAAG